MFAPGFGQRPKNKNPAHAINGNSDAKQKMKCWACGLIGHKKGDTICKAEGGAVHDSAPTKAKRKFNAGNERTNESGPSKKKTKKKQKKNRWNMSILQPKRQLQIWR
jgi:hypothetical protein